MAGIREFASGARFGAFPQEWGTPPGSPYSEERARWVRKHVEQRMARQAVERRVATPADIKVEILKRQRHLAALRRNWA